ncbi:MAG: sigma factor [Acetivibrionales bacterium]|jgi:RNA polymerase sigma factor
MREIDESAIKAQNNKDFLEVFICEYEPFIMHLSYKILGKYIHRSDDQWSVSLSAFNEAVKSYSFEKGSFISFAEKVIRRRLYDYIRKQSSHSPEVLVNPHVFENNAEEEQAAIAHEIMGKVAVTPNNDARLEIEELAQTLLEYGFSFSDLVSVSPKAVKTKIACAKAIIFVAKRPILLNELKSTKYLPIKIITENLNIPRKIIERHRKYIIAGIEITSGNYPILSDYLKFVREELER